MEQNEILEETRRTNELLRGQLLWMRAAAAVMIWRRGFVRTSPTANTPGSAVRVVSSAIRYPAASISSTP